MPLNFTRSPEVYAMRTNHVLHLTSKETVNQDRQTVPEYCFLEEKKALKAPLVSNYSSFWYILCYKETPLLLALEPEMLAEGNVFSN